jgi:hypothetical protein
MKNNPKKMIVNRCLFLIRNKIYFAVCGRKPEKLDEFNFLNSLPKQFYQNIPNITPHGEPKVQRQNTTRTS